MAQNSMPSKEEAEEFSKRADEIAMLVDGLAKGTLSPEYIDSKLEREREKGVERKAKTSQSSGQADEDMDEKQKAEVMKKVEEIKANMERKRRARERFEAYVKMHGQSAGTDYEKWDLWCPEDEEDEMIASCTPQNAQLKSMEKDINDRHHRIVVGRQHAERCRVLGNNAFGQQQWAEAYRCYEEGIDAERSNAKLHANAAMAALKMGCYAQAIEHCDKVLRIQEFLLEQPDDPLVVKVLQRRATARSALAHHKQALADLERALLTDPESSEVLRQHNRVQQDLAEERRLQALKPEPGSSADAPADIKAQLEACRVIEGLTRILVDTTLPCISAGKENQASVPAGLGPLPNRGTNGKLHSEAAITKAATEAKSKIAGSDDLRAYLRSCGGLTAAMSQVQAASQAPEERAAILTSCTELLNEACQIDTNARHVAGCTPERNTPSAGKSPTAFLAALCSLCSKHFSVTVLLHTLSTEAEARAAVAAAFTRSSGFALAEAVRSLPGLEITHRAILLSLLSNCAAVRAFQTALSAAMHSEQCESVLVDMLKAETNPAALERVAALVTNAASSAAIRRALGMQGSVGTLLVARTSEMLSQGQPDAALACLQCIYNLALESGVQTELVCKEWLAVLEWVMGDESISQLNDMGVCALFITARAASHNGMYSLLQAGGVVGRIAALALDAKLNIEQQLAKEAGSHKALKVLDASVRALTAWACMGQTEALLPKAMLQLLIWTCSAAPVGDSCAGNAALCLSHLADERRLSDLRGLEAIKALIDCAYHRKGSPASRNAGIAAAKLAKDPDCLEQLRACNGLDIIYNYVKP